jgi:hypothetical protein
MGDGQHWFYLEYRCGNEMKIERDENGRIKQLCDKCSHKYDDCRTQYSRRFKHGFVGGEYGSKSRIFGSRWYMDAVKRYGEPPAEYIEEALQAQKRVYESLGLAWKRPTKVELTDTTNDMAPPKKSGRTIKILRTSTSKVEETVPPVPKKNSRSNVKKTAIKEEVKDDTPKKKKRKAVEKVETITQDELKMPERFQSLTVSVIESNDSPKDVCDIQYIDLIEMVVDGKTVYVTPENDGEEQIMFRIENGSYVYEGMLTT